MGFSFLNGEENSFGETPERYNKLHVYMYTIILQKLISKLHFYNNYQ